MIRWPLAAGANRLPRVPTKSVRYGRYATEPYLPPYRIEIAGKVGLYGPKKRYLGGVWRLIWHGLRTLISGFLRLPPRLHLSHAGFDDGAVFFGGWD